MNRAKLPILLSLLLACSSLIFGQEEDPFGVVLYAEGAEISIFRDGDLYTYDALSEEVFGLPVFEGDLVQTDRGTFVEVQLMPSRTILKIAENTSFLIERLGQTGGNSFNILYGRVRAQVDQVAEGSNFSLRGRTAVAGVRGTDFGFDYVVERGSFTDPVTQVYCFEGSVEVSELADDSGNVFASAGGEENGTEAGIDESSEDGQQAPAPAQSVLIGANQMVSLRTSASERIETGAATTSDPGAQSVGTASLRQESLSADVRQFWTDNDIASKPVDVEEINTKFPNLKVRILEAKRAAQIAAERKMLQAGQRTEEEFTDILKSLELPDPSFADTLASLETVSAVSILPTRRPQVYQENAGRTLGLVFTGAGAISAIGAASVILWGEQVFGMSTSDVGPVGLGFLIGAAASMAIGLPLYFVNL